jgi:pimeloyl-ACP methyl ester carboxylesterase
VISGQYPVLTVSGWRRGAYTGWGNPGNPNVVICVHGLTRNARDFDELARHLEDHYYVVCADVFGRGHSDWLSNKADYGYPTYCTQMAALIAHLRAEKVDWVGTSMGGMIGMLLAAMPGAPIRRLVMNDIGPFVPKTALEVIAGYVGRDPVFDSVDTLEIYLRTVHAGFGKLTDPQWRHMANHSHRQDEQGKVRLAYDPAIGNAFRNAPLEDIDLTPMWQRVACETLVVRGANSRLLLPETFAQMCEKPKVRGVTIANVAHAPALMDAEQVGVVRDFLLQ